MAKAPCAGAGGRATPLPLESAHWACCLAPNQEACLWANDLSSGSYSSLVSKTEISRAPQRALLSTFLEDAREVVPLAAGVESTSIVAMAEPRPQKCLPSMASGRAFVSTLERGCSKLVYHLE